MLLGAALLGIAMWSVVSPALLCGWVALVLLNQLCRWRLTLAWRRARPGPGASARWGHYWAIGSGAAGALWGLAAVTMFPASAAYQALLIVCLFGVVLGGLNLTAVWRPSFYGFVLPALLPLILRVAWEGDAVHLYIALVLFVVLAFVLAFGHRVNDVLTQALAMRYENVDLIAELKGQTRAAVEARAAAEAANRAKSQLLAAASHDLRQPLHAVGLFVAALAARRIEPDARLLVTRVQQALEALEAQFGQLIDLSKLEAGMLVADRARVPLGPLFSEIAEEFAPQAEAKGLRLATVGTRLAVDSDPALLVAHPAQPGCERGSLHARRRHRRRRPPPRSSRSHRSRRHGYRHRARAPCAHLRGVLPGARVRRHFARRSWHGVGPCDRAPVLQAAGS